MASPEHAKSRAVARGRRRLARLFRAGRAAGGHWDGPYLGTMVPDTPLHWEPTSRIRPFAVCAMQGFGRPGSPMRDVFRMLGEQPSLYRTPSMDPMSVGTYVQQDLLGLRVGAYTVDSQRKRHRARHNRVKRRRLSLGRNHASWQLGDRGRADQGNPASVVAKTDQRGSRPSGSGVFRTFLQELINYQ